MVLIYLWELRPNVQPIRGNKSSTCLAGNSDDITNNLHIAPGGETLKKSLLLLVLGISLLTVLGCAGEKAGSSKQEPKLPPKQIIVEPESKDLKTTAEKVIGMMETRDWDSLYDYLSKDIKESISKDDFVEAKKQEVQRSKIEYKNYNIGEPKMVPEWVNTVNGKSYKNVAEIPYSVDVVTPKGAFRVENVIRLIQNSEQNWRYIWIRK